MAFPLRVQSPRNPADADVVAAGAAAKARIPARVVPALNMFIYECPGLLDEESGALICFHSLLPATLKAPLPALKPFYSSGGENIHEPSRR